MLLSLLHDSELHFFLSCQICESVSICRHLKEDVGHCRRVLNDTGKRIDWWTERTVKRHKNSCNKSRGKNVNIAQVVEMPTVLDDLVKLCSVNTTSFSIWPEVITCGPAVLLDEVFAWNLVTDCNIYNKLPASQVSREFFESKFELIKIFRSGVVF